MNFVEQEGRVEQEFFCKLTKSSWCKGLGLVVKRVDRIVPIPTHWRSPAEAPRRA